nr:TetR/AcrR family transcriptional regulator [Tropicimonas sp. IMCC34043]
MSCRCPESGNPKGPRRRGRPVQIEPERRQELLLTATAELLSERRLDEVTMTAVSDRAGMSKRTIYGMFDSREALLEAAITHVSRAIFRPLDDTARALPLADRLRRLMTVNTVPGAENYKIELLRTIITSAKAFPDLARRACDEGFGVLVRNIATEIDIGVRTGEIALPEDQIPLAARILVDMTFENPIPKLLRSDLSHPDPACSAERRELAIAIFLRGLAGPATGAGTGLPP